MFIVLLAFAFVFVVAFLLVVSCFALLCISLFILLWTLLSSLSYLIHATYIVFAIMPLCATYLLILCHAHMQYFFLGIAKA